MLQSYAETNTGHHIKCSLNCLMNIQTETACHFAVVKLFNIKLHEYAFGVPKMLHTYRLRKLSLISILQKC